MRLCRAVRDPSLTVNLKVDPSLGWLVAEIVPPISSDNSRLMASPSPVPPKRRAVDESAWVNF